MVRDTQGVTLTLTNSVSDLGRCLVAAGVSDLTRPAENLSIPQNIGTAHPHGQAIIESPFLPAIQLLQPPASSGYAIRLSLLP